MKSLRRFYTDTDGVVAVETAMVVSLFLVPMLLCLWDFTQIYQGKAAVDEAAEDAMTYVLSNGSAATTAGALAAAQAANGTSISVASSTVCYCISTSTTVPTVPTSVSCTGSCTSGVLQKFMSISTSKSVTIPLPVAWIKLTSPYTVTSTGLGRTG